MNSFMFSLVDIVGKFLLQYFFKKKPDVCPVKLIQSLILNQADPTPVYEP